MESRLSCEDYKELISAYYDSELSGDELIEVEEHIKECKTCKLELERLEKLSQYLKNSSVFQNIDIWSQIEPKLDDLYICKDITEKLSPYLDNELTKEEMLRINEHLLVCKYCSRDYENLKDVQSALKNYFKNSQNRYEIPDLKVREKVIQRFDLYERRRVLISSIAAVFVLAVLTWFSANTMEPIVFRNNSVADSRIYEDFTKAEDYLFSKTYSRPPEGVISILYEDE